MSTNTFDLIVIGSGPGGYVAAIRAAQLGLKTAIVEKQPWLGGTCLNWGCIPTKALIEAGKTYDKLKHLDEMGFEAGKIAYNWDKIQSRKNGIVDQQRKGIEFLMKKNKIEVLRGHGRLNGRGKVTVKADGGAETSYVTKSVLLATGSRVRELGFAKANVKGILNSDQVLSINDIPKKMCVVGGGVVGMEFASLFGKFGSEVTVVELAPQVLPFEDGEVVKELVRILKKSNVTVETGAKLTGVKDDGAKGVTVSVEGKEDRVFDRVLMSVGREPVTADIGLETVGIKSEKGGFLTVNDVYMTSVQGIYAIGDIIPTPALAHTASAEAIHAVEAIAGHKTPKIDYLANPSAIYTYPEVASIGYTEEKLKEMKKEYKVAKFPFAPMAKAKIEMATDGFIKILFEPKYKEILGVHILGAKATELIAEFVLGKVLETTLDEIGMAIHPHPTISETVMEAAHVGIGGAIHM